MKWNIGFLLPKDTIHNEIKIFMNIHALNMSVSIYL